MNYNLSKKLAVTALALSSFMVAGSAQASSILTGNLTVDDNMVAYISTDKLNIADSVIISTGVASDNIWNAVSSISSAQLAVGQDYYLHVYGINIANGAVNNPQGFIGEFSLDDSTHEFVTGGTTATSSDFLYGFDNWGEDKAVANAQKANGHNRNVGATGITSTDQWVWADYADATKGFGPNDLTDAYFTLEIKAVSAVPVPGAVWLFGTGLVGFIGMRKKAVKA